TVYLWYAAKAIRILYSAAIDVGLADLAFSKKSRQSLRNLNLAPVRSRLMNAHIIRDRGSFQGLERHRAGQIRHVEQLFRATPADDAGGQCRLRAVEKSETLFRAKVQRSQADAFKRFAAGDLCRGAEDFSFSNENKGEMSKRRQIAACANASPAGNHRIDVMVEQIA